MSHSRWNEQAETVTIFGFFFAALGVVICYGGFLWGQQLPNLGEVVGPALFFGAVVLMLLALPLRGAARTFVQSVRTRLGAGVFAGYLAIHLLLYGFLLEGILSLSFGFALFSVPSPGVFVFTDVFYPPSLSSALADLSFDPSIVVNVPPVFSVDLSFYSFALAIVIAVLVTANVVETRRVGALCSAGKRARSFVLVPTLGVVLGASCCLSVAGIVGFTLPLTLAADVASSLLISYITYYLLPAFAVLVLYLNLRSVGKVSERLNRGGLHD